MRVDTAPSPVGEPPQATPEAAPTISVVVPTLNEKDNIAPLVEAVRAALAGLDWEMIVVDDDSPDGTFAEVERVAASEPRLRGLRRVGRRGLSSAVIEGAGLARGEVVAVMDGDLQHDETALPRLYAALSEAGADLAIGSRFAKGGDAAALPTPRLAMSRTANGVGRALVGGRTSDPVSGFFLVRRAALVEAAPRLSQRGFKILLDLMTASPGLKVVEVPYRFRPRRSGVSKLGPGVVADFVWLALAAPFRPSGGPPRPGAVRGAWLWLAAILLVAAAIRFAGADFSLWYDEVASTKFAALPLAKLWSDWMVRETNPPLFYTLLKGWTALVGGGDASLRGLTTLIGLVGVVFAFLLGRRVAGDRAGLLAAALTALWSEHLHYSQEVRGYILAHTAALAAILGAVAFCAASDEEAGAGRRRRALALYAVACTVALYAHTTLVLLPALANVFVFGRFALRRPRTLTPVVEWTAANALVAVAWAWWARITWLQAQASAGAIGWITRPTPHEALAMTVRSFLPVPHGLLPVVAALALLLLAAAAWTQRRRPGLLLALVAVGAPLGLYLISLKTPVMLPRTLFWASGPFLVAAAVAVAAIPQPAARALAIGAALLLELFGLAAWQPYREAEPWRRVTAYLARRDPHAVVLAEGKGVAFAVQRYCVPPRCALRLYTDPAVPYEAWARDFPAPNLVTPAQRSALMAREHGRVVVLRRAAMLTPQEAADFDSPWPSHTRR